MAELLAASRRRASALDLRRRCRNAFETQRLHLCRACAILKMMRDQPTTKVAASEYGFRPNGHAYPVWPRVGIFLSLLIRINRIEKREECNHNADKFQRQMDSLIPIHSPHPLPSNDVRRQPPCCRVDLSKRVYQKLSNHARNAALVFVPRACYTKNGKGAVHHKSGCLAMVYLGPNGPAYLARRAG